jgi:hypothetical protein
VVGQVVDRVAPIYIGGQKRDPSTALLVDYERGDVGARLVHPGRLEGKAGKAGMDVARTVVPGATCSGSSVPPYGRMSVASKPASTGCRGPVARGSPGMCRRPRPHAARARGAGTSVAPRWCAVVRLRRVATSRPSRPRATRRTARRERNRSARRPIRRSRSSDQSRRARRPARRSAGSRRPARRSGRRRWEG